MRGANHRIQREKKGRAKQPELQTADDFLADGVAKEESGDRWSFDKAKARRFFDKALQSYATSQSIKPDFENTYNRGRLLLVISQGFASKEESGAMLHDAIGYLRNSLAGDRNGDAMFNLGQALVASAESRPSGDERAPQDVLEAISTFTTCFTQQTALQQADQDMEERSEEGSASENHWAKVIEPVTDDGRLDTLIALIQAVTAYTTLTHSEGRFGDLNLPSTIQMTKDLAVNVSRETEAGIAISNLEFALTDVQFQQGRASLLDLVLVSEKLADIEATFERLCNQSDALTRIAHLHQLHGDVDSAWTALTASQEALTKACKIKSDVASVWIGRGDLELMRANMSGDRSGRNHDLLLKNAAIYYQNAIKVEPQSMEASVKLQVAKTEAGEPWSPNADALTILQEVAEEGMIDLNKWHQILG